MMLKTNKTYVVDFRQNLTRFKSSLDAGWGIPYIEIFELESNSDTVYLRFHDKKSVESLMLALQTIKDEMDRFEPNDQSVS